MSRLFLPAFVLLALSGATFAQTGYPMIMSLKPVAAQVGQSAEIEFQSRYSMLGASQVLVTGDGVTAEVLHPEVKPGEKPNLTAMKARFTVAPGTQPGVRDVRIMTPQGVSTVGQLVLVRDPVVYEQKDNNTAAQAQLLAVPTTACGCIEKNEDIDFFKFQVDAGKELHFHVRCQRLQDRIHDLQNHADPMITIRNSAGSTVAASDNAFFGDPFMAVKFEHAGEYTLEVRDVRYEGNQYWEYSIEISDRPFVTNVYPLGVAPGQETSLTLIGTQLPESRQVKVTLPAETRDGGLWQPAPLADGLSNPFPVFVSRLPLAMETDADNNAPAGGQMIAVPSGINGRISTESDVDCYRFEAKKGDAFTFEVQARRHQSSLDPYLRITREDGTTLVENDDLRDFKRGSADSRIDNWTAPADGTYVLEIRDMHLRGGDSYVYFIEAIRAEPHFRLYADTDKTLLTPGTNGVFFVRVERKNGFTGEVQLQVEGLPQGVEAICGRILPDSGQDGCVILKAAPDAPQGVTNIRISGTSTWKKTPEAEPLMLAAEAVMYQETYQPGGGRGHWPVETHAVSVGALSDIRSIKLSEYDITLKPGESKTIEVTLERAPGFEANVTLDVLFQHLGIFCNTLPPGVTFDESKSSKLITGKNVKGHVVLKCDDKAVNTDRQLVPVTGNVSLNFVMKTTFAADPLWISVVKP